MRVSLCEGVKRSSKYVARLVDEVEGYAGVRWWGGLDVVFESQEELGDFLKKHGKYVYCVGDMELEEVVGELLKAKGLKLVVAESCTGGLLSARIVNVPGSSAYFMGGFVVYSNDLKVRLLGVEEEAIKTYGAVSEEVCKQMAVGALKRTSADIAIAISGVSGPGGSPQKPQGLTYIALANGEEVAVRKFTFNGSRNENRFMATQWALEMLRLHILKEG
ncbi:MAG: nicotinamide-nucleotide amidohydrolase family protein [Aquificaceae bacterium]|nr:nicotinamide-nucleotide amidohydrolase family protein [Aquificaceae bacterium]MCX8076062.1 nicotinamide-nucleotide amidohydrolase family protein [Aquificaceae bacterium]